MQTAISSIGLIAEASEVCRIQHKLIWSMRGALVWAANAVITTREREETPEVIEKAEDKLATLHVIACQFRLGIPFVTGPRDVEAHLSLTKEPALHEEALKLAENKALTSRNLGRMKEYYEQALQSIGEQRKVRRSRVDEIEALCDPTGMNLDPDSDYDEYLVEREMETIEGAIAQACEVILDMAESKLEKHMLPKYLAKWTGFKKGALGMMEVLGVTPKDQSVAREKFRAAMAAEVAKINAPVEEARAAMKVEAPSPVKRATQVEVTALNQHAHMERTFADTRDAFESGNIGRSQAVAELKSIGRTGTEVRKWHNPRARVVKAMADIGTLTQ